MTHRKAISLSAATLLLLAGTATAAWRLSSHLEQFSQWLMARVRPDLDLIVGSIDMRSVDQYVISDLLIRPKANADGEFIWVERAVIDIAWKPPLGVAIRSIRADSPSLDIGPALFESLIGGSDPDGGAATDGGRPLLPAVRITDGHCTLRVPDMPRAEFSFTVEPTADGALLATAENLRAGAADAATQSPALTAGRVEMRLARDALRTSTIHTLRLVRPIARVTPEISGPTPTAPGVATPPGDPAARGPIAVPKALRPWSINALVMTDGTLTIRGFPDTVPVVTCDMDATIGQLGLSGDLGRRPHEVRFQNLRVATSFAPGVPFLDVPRATARFRPRDLLDRRIAAVEVHDARFLMDRAFRSMVGSRDAARSDTPGPRPPSPGTQAPSPFWMVEAMRFDDTAITLADLGRGIPDIRFTLPESELLRVALTGDAQAAGGEPRTVEIADLVVFSPLDPFTPVLSFPSIFVEFSLAGLIRREVDSLAILHPTIHVGPELFWYLDTLGRPPGDAADTAPSAPDAPPWTIRSFSMAHGRLAIATGAGRVSLPLPFETRARDIQLDSPGDWNVELDIQVPPGDYDFPAYQLALDQLTGTLRFGLPPDSGANNLVNTLTVDHIQWRQFSAEDAWIAVTYDAKGIYGEFGTSAYSGWVNGGFSYLVQPGNPWSAWCAGTMVSLDQLTNILSPQNVRMDSPADFSIEANADGPLIRRVRGALQTTAPGTLRLPHLARLLDHLPPEWSNLKTDLTRIGVQALADFPYESGHSDFWFIDKHGRLSMELTGPAGSRTFDVVVHDTPFNAPRLWEQSVSIKRQLRLTDGSPR